MKTFKRHKDLVKQAVSNTIKRQINRFLAGRKEAEEAKQKYLDWLKKNDWLQWAKRRIK